MYLHIWPEALFKPAFALPRKRMRDYALRMSDVWKMAESNRRLLLCSPKIWKQKQSDYRCDLYFHVRFNERCLVNIVPFGR
jgi:hypothetical protein